MDPHGRCVPCLCRKNSHLVSPELALSVACRASCAALAIGFIEQLRVFQSLFGEAGPSSPAVARAMGSTPIPGLLLERTQRWVRYVILVGACASTLVTVLGPYPPLGRIALVVTFGCVVVIRIRRVTGGDGAEQMATLTLFAAGVALLPGLDPDIVILAVWFLGGQSILSYATAGIAKAVAPSGQMATPFR